MNKKAMLSAIFATLLSASTIGTAHAQSTMYQVQTGDTLSKIATVTHTTVSQLQAWNGLSSTIIRVGQTLKVTLPEKTYVVQSGDMISKIAKTNNLLIADIKLRNNLTSDTLKVGQKVIIPSQKGVYTKHTVIAGNTLSTIARDYMVSLANLKAYNQLTTEFVKVGQVLVLIPNAPASQPTSTTNPSQSTTSTPVVSQPTTTEPSTNQTVPTLTSPLATIHVVQAGEYLGTVAKQHDTTIDAIKQLNGLTTDTIFVGQPLKVTTGEMPAPQTPSFLANGQFPLAEGTYTPFGDTWGNSRQYGGDRTHEGTDIMAPIGTPIYSATDGKVVNYGWNELGGWRISIKSPEGYNLYYAHLSKYATGMTNGVTVEKGQLIGYVGNTGYGTEGTSGKFASHLHFGLYNSQWVATNPYGHLKYWASQQ